jgi:hypothetical protein
MFTKQQKKKGFEMFSRVRITDLPKIYIIITVKFLHEFETEVADLLNYR